jgi:hypothetical protein
MVTCNDNLDRMRLFTKPIELFLDVCYGAGICKISCMNENVTVGNVDFEIVCVGDADDANGGLVTRRVERSTAEEEYSVVEEKSEIC